MRLSFAEMGLQSLDALAGADAACLLVFEDERPLRGLAGCVDWRLCGGLSRVLMAGRFVGAAGDALLFPVPCRLQVARIFCYGAGRKRDFSRNSFTPLMKQVGQALSRAGVRGFVTQLPQVIALDPIERARIFQSECLGTFNGDRVILFGEGKGMAKTFAEAGTVLRGLEIDREPLVHGKVTAPPAARGVRVG